MCRSVHSEANAIIAAPRDQMIGSTLYMCCTDPKTGEVVPDTNSCMMCKRLILNAGIETVVIRDRRGEHRIIETRNWIEDDDSLSGEYGY